MQLEENKHDGATVAVLDAAARVADKAVEKHARGFPPGGGSDVCLVQATPEDHHFQWVQPSLHLTGISPPTPRSDSNPPLPPPLESPPSILSGDFESDSCLTA